MMMMINGSVILHFSTVLASLSVTNACEHSSDLLLCPFQKMIFSFSFVSFHEDRECMASQKLHTTCWCLSRCLGLVSSVGFNLARIAVIIPHSLRCVAAEVTQKTTVTIFCIGPIIFISPPLTRARLSHTLYSSLSLPFLPHQVAG
uniref:Putative secreted protein n=1 Tax=Anopheles marajoara TaxID=58244 RepID=A0A2M4C708_9DIPT